MTDNIHNYIFKDSVHRYRTKFKPNKRHKKKKKHRSFKPKITRAEKVFAAKLKARGIEFEQQKYFRPFYVDFWLPEHAWVVEIDGIHHRNNADQRERDEARTAYLLVLSRIQRVVRITNWAAMSPSCEPKDILFNPKVGTWKK